MSTISRAFLQKSGGVAPADALSVVQVGGNDMRWDGMGAVGHPFIEAPNTDRLARGGRRERRRADYLAWRITSDFPPYSAGATFRTVCLLRPSLVMKVTSTVTGAIDVSPTCTGAARWVL